MPSLRIAIRNFGVFNIGLFHHSTSKLKSSDSNPANQSTAPVTTPIKSNDTTPTDRTSFFTSTPTTKSAAHNIFPADISLLEDTLPPSDSFTSLSSSTIGNTDIYSVNTMIIEQYQILPERIWEYRYVVQYAWRPVLEKEVWVIALLFYSIYAKLYLTL